MNSKYLLSVILFCISFTSSFSQMKFREEFLFNDSLSVIKKDKGIRWEILGPSAAVIAGTNIYLYYYYEDAYYNSKRVKFHTFNDWNNADLNSDKLGHIYGGSLFSRTSYKLYEYSNLPETYSLILSTLTSLFFQLQVEYHDAFFEAWGWSWWDFGGDVIGAVYPNLQRLWKPLETVNLKWSYWPSAAYKKGWYDYWIKDYEGMHYWLTFDVHSYLPEKIDKYWPDWLNLAIGYGTDKIKLSKTDWNSFGNGGEGDREYYISVDYDLLKIFKPEPGFWHEVLYILNVLHFPAPAIKLTPKPVFYFLFL